MSKKLTTEEFILKSINVHCQKYNYQLVKYINAHNKIKIICLNHGIFEQLPKDHLYKKAGCPKCTHQVSKPELEICFFLDKLNVDYEQSDRSILEGKELDIVIHSKKIAIEFNGRYWHSDEMILERTKGKMNAEEYHQMKTNMCNKKGYKLLHIFEEDWVEDKEKELDRIEEFLK